MHKHFKNLWAHLNRHLGKMWVWLAVFLRASMRSDSWLGGMWRRAGVLGCAVVGGFILGQCVSPWLLYFFPEGVYGGVRVIAGTAPITLPTFFTLWWFRTYDSRHHSQRANFEMGVKQIDSDTPISIEIGTLILIKVSNVTTVFNDEIAFAFIKRLQRSPADTAKNKEIVGGGYRWGYARQMLQWLKSQNKKYDLDLLDLRNQEFPIEDAQLTIGEVLKMHTDVSLTVDVTGCSKLSMENFLSCCPYALSMWKEAKIKYDSHDENKSPSASKTMNELPSVRFLMTCPVRLYAEAAAKNSESSTNTAK